MRSTALNSDRAAVQGRYANAGNQHRRFAHQIQNSAAIKNFHSALEALRSGRQRRVLAEPALTGDGMAWTVLRPGSSVAVRMHPSPCQRSSIGIGSAGEWVAASGRWRTEWSCYSRRPVETSSTRCQHRHALFVGLCDTEHKYPFPVSRRSFCRLHRPSWQIRPSAQQVQPLTCGLTYVV